MALTKLPTDGIATGAVTSAKIADGTIQNQDISGSLTNTQLQNSTITFGSTPIALGSSISFNSGTLFSWQSVKTSNFTAVAGNGYFIDTTAGSITMTLPASPSAGDSIAFVDYAGTFATYNLTIARNGSNIQGVANNSLISTNQASLTLVYVDATKGWLYTDQHNVSDLQQNSFITATGGTITTSGNFKIHTFTGCGCFTVTQTGVGPSGGPAVVDYLVVAGGGGGASSAASGGGAGGYRLSSGTSSGSYSVPAPLAGSVPGITVIAQTYPITVGAGGSGAYPGSATSGSNSIFSTITSAGGGAGTSGNPGNPGGSGGGNSYAGGTPGTGNTPPVSPPQGNPGGPGGYLYIGGGGGGAGSPGNSGGGPTGPGGPGGSGSANSISGSPVTYAGGGGGNNGQGSANPGGSGGSGGGGAGGTNGQNGTPGTANTGGGGGGGFNSYFGGTGGKGIVIIRYKYQ